MKEKKNILNVASECKSQIDKICFTGMIFQYLVGLRNRNLINYRYTKDKIMGTVKQSFVNDKHLLHFRASLQFSFSKLPKSELSSFVALQCTRKVRELFP